MSRRSWELLHSLWIILTFTYFTNWLAFIYVGLRTRNRRWSLYGVIYILPFALTEIFMSYFINPSMINAEGVVTDSFVNAVSSLFLIPWLISIGHAFYIRKEYLMRLESLEQIHNAEELHFQRRLKEMEDAKERELRHNVNKEYNMDYYESKWLKSSDNSSNDKKGNVNKTTFKESTSLLVDINHDPAEVIAKLPGVGIILAKKAVKLRQDSQFKSLEEFGEVLGLKPHILEQIRHSVVVEVSETKIQKGGRLVDI
ncbi:MAG TPA: helix-hairpin-helix domain-containing protein [Methanobacterium sp.]|nr:helix-hairpin-helix domain-containing protein [Methanobacterium sp.]